MEKNAHRLASPTLLGRTWQHLRMMLLTAMLAAMTGQTARAQEGTRTLTVYDGTTTNEEIPAYFDYFNWFARSQFVIPEYKLDDMTGGTISSLTFYTTSNNVPYTTTCSADVYLMEVGYTTMKAFEPKAFGTIVYQGTLSIVAAGDGGTMTINFSTPYTYSGGGNLLICIENTAKGGSINIDFYGQTVNAAAWSGVNESSLDAVTGYQQNFIPKTTFIFTPGSNPIYYRPTDPTLADVDATTATLCWTSPSASVTEYAYQYKQTGTEAWSTEATVNATTATLSNLTATTAYDFRVKALYNGGESKYATLRFTTTAIPVAVGDSWSDDFEGDACSWMLVNGDCTNAWTWGTAVSNGGTHALYISNDGGTTHAYDNAYSPSMVYAAKPFSFEGGKYEFTYDWLCYGESTCDFLRVALVPATETLKASMSMPRGFSASSLPSGWIALDGGGKLNLTQEWQSKSAAVSNLAAGTYYLVFAWWNDNTVGNQPPAAVDNVSIRHWSCPADVDNLAVSYTGGTTATLSWAAGEATQWQVAYSTSSNFAQATEAIVNLNPNLNVQNYTLTDLPIGSTCYARVRAYCGGTDYGKWSDAVTFAIEANPVPTNVTATAGTRKATLSWTAYGDSYNVRYKNKGLSEGFENDGLGGWTMVNCLNGTGIFETVKAGTNQYAYHSGSHGFAFAASDNDQQSLISPELSITEGMKLEFYYRTTIATSTKKIRVGFSSTTNDANSFEWGNEVSVNNRDWNRYSIDIPTGTKYICIKQTYDSYKYYLLIDDISVYQAEWTTATAQETGITLTGLAPETTYEYQVQSVKDEAASAWTELATFTTEPLISIELADDGTANATTLSTCDGKEDVTVTLSGRTIYADGTWQALCLPFALNTLNGTPLDGFTVKELDTEGKWEKINGQWTTSSNGHQTGLDNDGKVYLHFKDATSIEAGKPYFVSKLVMDEGGTQPTYQATEGTAGSTTSQEFTNLIDGRGAGYTWRTSGLPSYCMFEASKPVYVTGYTLTTGNQNVNGHPTVWTLEARISKSDEWTVIDSRNANQNSSDALPSERTANKNYTIQQPGVYKFFRFEVQQTNGNSFMCITELTLQGTPVVEGDVVNPVFTGVTINATAPATVSSLDAQVSITGSYDAVAANGKGRSLFFPGSGSRLYNAQAGTTLGACRAFFNIGDGSMQPTLGGSNCLQGIVVPNLLPGDADNDGFVTIDDVIAVVNYILGNTPDNFNVANADVDTNIGITITDAVTIVNMVLTQQEPEPETE